MGSDEFDVIVVGFGCAGACAAITAADAGASVLILDRGYGGGSTYHSGGVVYAGAGTAPQLEAGIEDTAEDTFSYLRAEIGDVVSDATLRRFARGGPEMIDWLQCQGLEFEGSVCPYKTSYPTNRHYLYYSGNELVSERAAVAAPAPRGHRHHAKNFSGAAFFNQLRDTALAKGVSFRPMAEVQRLVLDDSGRVSGVEFLAPSVPLGKRHEAMFQLAAKLSIYYPPVGRRLTAIVERKRRAVSERRSARARSAVILTTGGHAFNRRLVAEHAPAWADLPPLGTIGDDGAAMRLAAPLNAKTDYLQSMSGWRFISPPSSFMAGIVVNRHGERFVNEQLYGATMAKPLVEEHEATGYLIMDASTWRAAKANLRQQTAFFHAPQMMYLFGPAGHKRAATLAGLADKLGMNVAGLAKTVADHNAAIDVGRPDEFGKSDEFRCPLREAPFYAIDISFGNQPAFPAMFISLGGLVVDESTGEVVDSAGAPITGLYAAGRSAVGLCSGSYVSGLSLADAVFSGRRAGAHAAEAAAKTKRAAAE